jgi:hypothetical protein
VDRDGVLAVDHDPNAVFIKDKPTGAMKPRADVQNRKVARAFKFQDRAGTTCKSFCWIYEVERDCRAHIYWGATDIKKALDAGPNWMKNSVGSFEQLIALFRWKDSHMFASSHGAVSQVPPVTDRRTLASLADDRIFSTALSLAVLLQQTTPHSQRDKDIPGKAKARLRCLLEAFLGAGRYCTITLNTMTRVNAQLLLRDGKLHVSDAQALVDIKPKPEHMLHPEMHSVPLEDVLDALVKKGCLTRKNVSPRILGDLLLEIGTCVEYSRNDPKWTEKHLRHLYNLDEDDEPRALLREALRTHGQRLEVAELATRVPGFDPNRVVMAVQAWGSRGSAAAGVSPATSSSGSDGPTPERAAGADVEMDVSSAEVGSSLQKPQLVSAKQEKIRIDFMWEKAAQYNASVKDSFGDFASNPEHLGLHWDGFVQDGSNINSMLCVGAKRKVLGWCPPAETGSRP